MATDDERREVARRLRELASDADEVSDFDLAKTLELGAVSRYGYDPRDVERLADLIEPSCDREALEVAGEMEIDGAGALDDGDWCKPLLVEYARCIREACGEVVA